ncbi:hypothetical protein AM305_05028, partial [Actinobacillus minor NM305]
GEKYFAPTKAVLCSIYTKNHLAQRLSLPPFTEG